MENRFTRYIIFAAASFWLVAPVHTAKAQSQATEYTTWTNLEGREIEAIATHFNREEKKVIWELSNGRVASSPLADLTAESRSRLLNEPAFKDFFRVDIRNYDIKKLSPNGWIWAGLVCLVLPLISLSIAFLSFKLAVRCLTDPNRDLLVFLKLFAAGWVTITMWILCLYNVATKSSLPALVGTVTIPLIAIFFLFWLLMGHYRISFMRALGLSILHALFAIPLQFVSQIVGILMLGILFRIVALEPEHIYTFADELLYRPTGLLP